MIYNIFFRAMTALCFAALACGLVAVGAFVERMLGVPLHEMVLAVLVYAGISSGMLLILLMPTLSVDFSGKSAKGERREMK